MKIEYQKLLDRLNVVGVIASGSDMDMVQQLYGPDWQGNPASLPNILEFRVDKVPTGYLHESSTGALFGIKRPFIITVRDASEGGGQLKWNARDRRDFYMEFMPHATFVDIEATTVGTLMDVVQEARKQSVGIIISCHNLNGMITEAELIDHATVCAQVKGDVFKVAMKVRTPQEFLDFQAMIQNVTRLADMKGSGHRFKVVSMATGSPYGQISRYVHIFNGGNLIYGSLGEKAVVPGQPKALEIRRNLETVFGWI